MQTFMSLARRACVAAVSAAVGIVSAGPARADTVLSYDFECPAFSLGALAGQSGWLDSGTVQTAVVNTAAGGGLRAARLVTGVPGHISANRPISIATSGQTFTITADLRRSGSAGAVSGLAVYGDTGLVGQIATLSGVCLVGNFNNYGQYQLFNDNQWNRVVLTLNFPAGTVSISVNGTPSGSLPINNPGGVTRLTNLQVLINGSGGLAESFFDNVSLATSGLINNPCAEAAPVALGSTAFSTVGASTDGPAHLANCNFTSPLISNDVWYSFTAPAAGALTVSTCGSLFDTGLAVYGGANCGALLSSLLACNDNNPACGADPGGSQLVITVAAGQSYLIRVGGYLGSTGTGTLTLSLESTGGCCNRRTGQCTVLSSAQCAAVGLNFLGFGAACSSACQPCPGDFNNSGAASVQDIFDFLAAYFTDCP